MAAADTAAVIDATAAVRPPPPHLVRIERRHALTCETLDPDPLARLQAVLRAQPWYSDRIARRPFRRAVLETIQSSGRGLVLLGRMPFEPPPPFDEIFEPIQLGTSDPQMKTLSGSAPTRQERMGVLAFVALAVIGLAVLGPALIGILRGGWRTVATVGLVLLTGLGAVVGLVTLLTRFSGDWFLVPGGVVIRAWPRRTLEPLVLLTPCEAGAMVRYVSTGKTTVLMLELWRGDGRRWRRAVSEREAMTFLAAWRSDEPAPPLDRLRELLAS